MTEAVTPETAAVDAPVSMDSIIEEIASGNPAEEAEAVSEVVEELEGGEAEAAGPEEDETEAAEPTEETAEEESESEEPEPTYKVKVNGEEVEVPLSELTKGYSREQDYTKKTMALAEEKKTLQSKFAEELKQATDLFVSLDPILSEARNIDWQALSQTDPATYVQLRHAVDERLAAVNQARAKIAEASNGNPEAEAAAKAEAAKETEAALTKARPELADPEKMLAFAKDNIAFLSGEGLAPNQMEEYLLDPVAVQIIDDARRYRELKKAESQIPAKKVVPKPKAKALRSSSPDSSRPAKRLSENASLDARVNHVLTELLGSK